MPSPPSPTVLYSREGAFHRAPAHSRFQQPMPPSSPYSAGDSAMPRFWSAVPRTHTHAGNLRLLQPIGYIAPRDETSLRVGPKSPRDRCFQYPSPQPMKPFHDSYMGRAPTMPRTTVTSRRVKPGTSPTPGSLDSPPKPHYFGLFGELSPHLRHTPGTFRGGSPPRPLRQSPRMSS